jgi:hypothetical protein
MNRGKFNYDYLIQKTKELNIKLIKDYKNLKINRDTIIEGNCLNHNCSQTFNKTFNNMIKYSAFCKECTKNNKKTTLKKTCLEKYGVENIFQHEEIKKTIKKTCLKKYGVENPSYSNEIKDKIKNIFLQKYNVTSSLFIPEVIQKRKEACLNKYGNEIPMKTELGKLQFKKKCLEKYGFENPQQNAEIAEKTSKNSYIKKEYIFPSGIKIFCQGYEHLALEQLINDEKIEENDIVTGCKNVPTIWYNDELGIKHRHYVDIYIPSQNRCIEVKSTWTAQKKINNIYLKQNAGKELGYKYEIWIYNNKKELVDVKY